MVIMRIAVSGTACQGKTTLINDFLKEWPSYETPTETYRKFIKKGNNSENTSEELQMNILNFMIDQMQSYRKEDKVIFDRCPLDNLIYSMWSAGKRAILEADDDNKEDVSKYVSDEFVDKIIPIIRESMKYIDIILFIPLTKCHTVPIVDDGTRTTDPEYIREIDTLFKSTLQYYYQNKGPFFDHDDKPAIIEVFGTPEQRLQMIKMYLDIDGDAIGEEQSLINPNEVNELYQQITGDNSIYK